MSTRNGSRAPEGIEVRVASNGTKSYRASVWSARDQKRIRRTFPTLAAAKAWRQDTGRAVRRGTLRAAAPTTVRQAGDAWLDGARGGLIRTRTGHAYKPASIRNYERALRLHVLPVIGGRKLADVRRVDVQDLVDGLVAQGYGAVTVQCAILPLRAIYRRALDRGELAVNPTSKVNVPAVRRAQDRITIPSLERVQALLDALEPRDRALYATAVYAGLRLGELQALKWENVDLGSGVIRVEAGWDRVEREAIDPKSEDGRRAIPTAAVLRRVLLAHRMATTGDGYVFGTTPTRPFSASGLDKRVRIAWGWKREKQAPGRYAWVKSRSDALEPIKLHHLRHTCASVMIAAGINAKALSTYMGHSSIQVTFDLYGHLMPGYMDEAAGMLDAYLARASMDGRAAALL
jgi:integrase